MMQFHAALIGVLISQWLQCINTYAPQHRRPLAGGGKLHSRRHFTNDLDILPYGVLQQLNGAHWRPSRQMDWSERRLQTPPVPVLSHSSHSSHSSKPKMLHRQQQLLQSSRLASRRMPRLQRMSDNYYNLYDVDGEHLLGLHYHNDALTPAAPVVAQQTNIAKSSQVASSYNNGDDGGWRPVLAPTSPPRPAQPRPQLRSYNRVQQKPQVSHTAQRDGRQVQHFWLQL